MTATFLMNYVYDRVSSDPASSQTPHHGHLLGDGDFILTTPGNSHLNGGGQDFLAEVVPERPEPVATPSVDFKPVFAEKNGYGDPESDTFGKKE